MRRQGLAFLAGFLAACGGGGGGGPAPVAPTPVTVALVPVATGLSAPVLLTHAGDTSGRRFVVEQVGRIRILDAGGTLLPAPFLDLVITTYRALRTDQLVNEATRLLLAAHRESPVYTRGAVVVGILLALPEMFPT